MGRRGPKPESAKALRARGSTLAKSRERQEREQRERAEAAKAGDDWRLENPPSWLTSPIAKRVWADVVPLLGATTVLDSMTMAIFADACGQYVEASRTIRKEGLTIAPGGVVAKHPLTSVMNQLRAAILKYAGELGCTPAARQRLDWVFVEHDDGGPAPDEADIRQMTRARTTDHP